jgi:hypothetical protein
MKKRMLLTGIILALIVWQPSWSRAYEGEFFSSQKLQEAYRRFCSANTDELKALLATKKTMALGINQPVIDVYGSMLKCEYESDPLYKGLEDLRAIKRTEALIRKIGKEKYADQSIASLASAKRKYKVDYLLRILEKGSPLSGNQVKVLVTFARTKAEIEAVASVLRSGEGKEPDQKP